MEENRNFSRIRFQAHTKIEINTHSYGGELLDISLKGALISASDRLPIKLEEDVRIRVFLPSSSIALSFNARLVHLEQNRYGFKFTGYDAESMTHLRRLLEFNLGDQDQVVRELYFLQKVS
ncbi:MAG: PilZ domain-containing protein [Deltaproteobacteria bacterium]|nr:PilZ domain-containing protein [Deltaproteobacteria bacterium]